MLCPEVWNFKAPESSFNTKKIDPNENEHLRTIHNFVYNHLVSVILPDTLTVPTRLTEVLSNDCDYYKISNVKLSEFITKDFLDSFVNSGNLYVLSVQTRIDCDNCVALTPSGQLILSLNKSDYQSLGLEGSVSHFHTKTQDRYNVTIDLKQKHFNPGKPNYERVRSSLEGIRHDVIVTWGPPKPDICPSSIAKYFHDLEYKVQLCETKHQSHTIYSSKVPKVEDDNHYDIVEWLGMIALGGNLSDGSPDNYVTTYETPEPNHNTGQIKFLQWRGFFTADQISRLYQTLSAFKKTHSEFVAMYVQGFSDSPIAWKGEEHHFYTNGDNSYTFILAGRDVISCVQKCSRKRYNNKRKGKPL